MDLTQDISNEFENAVEDELKKVQQQQNEAVASIATLALAMPGIVKAIINLIEGFKRKYRFSLKKGSDPSSGLEKIKEIASKIDNIISIPFDRIIKLSISDNEKRKKVVDIVKGVFLLILTSGSDLTTAPTLKTQISTLLQGTGIDIAQNAITVNAEKIGELLKKVVNSISLKEQIKSLIRKQIEEMSVTGGGEAYSTPFAFAKKGQKTNAAIQTAKSQGMKLVPAGIPSDSKVKDYKAIWKSAEKPKYKMYKESLVKLIEQELLNEVTYSKFKKEVKHRTKSEQLHKAIREVKRKLMEIDRIVEYTSRMKQELSEDEGGISYWKATQNNIGRISEMVNQLNNKIKNLHQ